MTLSQPSSIEEKNTELNLKSRKNYVPFESRSEVFNGDPTDRAF